MILTSIDIKNWKCFEHKTLDFDRNLNSINWVNGSGKSSLIQAIIISLFNQRPNGLSFDDLRNDLNKSCEIKLYFTHNGSDYIVDRAFGKSSKSELYRDGELISRTVKETQDLIDKMLPQSLAEGLWGHNALSLSPILKTEYLFDILENEFKEPLEIKKYFQTEKTAAQKRLSSLKKTITNQDITEEQVNNVKKELDELIKKADANSDLTNMNDVVKAKDYESKYPDYIKLKDEFAKMSAKYDIDESRRLNNLLKSKNITTKEHWNSYFENIEKEIEIEKHKLSDLHPLTKYPKNVIDSILKESKKENKCIVCGGEYHEIKLDYDKIDQDKIDRLENELKDKDYDFIELVKSIKYYATEKKVNDLAYLDEWDWKSVLDNFNEERNEIIKQRNAKKEEYERLKVELAEVTELLKVQKEYDNAKECIEITEQYIDEAKAYYSNSIVTEASKKLNKINPRYEHLTVDDGVYKVLVYTEDFSNCSYLPVASLSAGEKTLISLCLILTVRDMFIPEVPLIFDESFAALDASNSRNIQELIQKDYGQWIIVSHGFDFIK